MVAEDFSREFEFAENTLYMVFSDLGLYILYSKNEILTSGQWDCRLDFILQVVS